MRCIHDIVSIGCSVINIFQPYSFICSMSSRSIPRVESMSMCRQREGWAARLGVGRDERLKGIYSLTKYDIN